MKVPTWTVGSYAAPVAVAASALTEMLAAGDEAGQDDEGEPAGEEATEEPWVPQVGEEYSYKPVGAKTKKPGKAVEVTVTAVNAKKELVDLQNSANRKVAYKGVRWDALESAIE